MYRLSPSLALLILSWSELATASLSYCRASSPCTIFQDSYSITFKTENYIYITFTNANEYSSFQSSLSAASLSSAAGPFEITVASNTAATAITPPPIIIETKPGQFTTVKCCNGGMVYGNFVLNGENHTTVTNDDDNDDGDTTCGARKTMLFNQGNFTYNDFTVTVARTATSTTLDFESLLGSNTCVTVGPNVQGPMPPLLTPPPVTKTFVAELVLNTKVENSDPAPVKTGTVAALEGRTSSSDSDSGSIASKTDSAAGSTTALTADDPVESESQTGLSNRPVTEDTTPSSTTNEPSTRNNGTIYVTASDEDIISNGNWTHTVHVVVTADAPIPTLSSVDESSISEEAAASDLPSRRRKNSGAKLQAVYTLWILPGALIAMNWLFW